MRTADGDPPRDTLVSTAKSYERIARTYASNHADDIGEHVARTRTRFADGLSEGATVADLGCGPGRDLRWFTDRGLIPVGVDAALEMLRLPLHRDGIRVQADLRRLPFADESLDGIWCASTLLHVTRNDVGDVLTGFRRVVREGGLLGLVTPVGDEEGWELVPYDASAQPYDQRVRRWFAYFQPSELAGLLSPAGFEVHHEETVERFKTWWHAVLMAV